MLKLWEREFAGTRIGFVKVLFCNSVSTCHDYGESGKLRSQKKLHILTSLHRILLRK